MVTACCVSAQLISQVSVVCRRTARYAHTNHTGVQKWGAKIRNRIGTLRPTKPPYYYTTNLLYLVRHSNFCSKRETDLEMGAGSGISGKRALSSLRVCSTVRNILPPQDGLILRPSHAVPDGRRAASEMSDNVQLFPWETRDGLWAESGLSFPGDACAGAAESFKIPKMDGIFHYFNESFVIDPLNDFERHFAWLSKTSLLLKIG